MRRVLVDEHELPVGLAHEVRQVELPEVAQPAEVSRHRRRDPILDDHVGIACRIGGLGAPLCGPGYTWIHPGRRRHLVGPRHARVIALGLPRHPRLLLDAGDPRARRRRGSRPRRCRPVAAAEQHRGLPRVRPQLARVAIRERGRAAVDRKRRWRDAGDHVHRRTRTVPPRGTRHPGLHHVPDRRGHHRRLREPHLALLRVHVVIDAAGRHVEQHHRHRVAPARDQLAVPHRHRVEQAAVAHGPSPDEQLHPARRRLRELGRREVRRHAHPRLLATDRHERRRRSRPEQCPGAREPITLGGQLERRPAVVTQLPVDRRERHREPGHHLGHVRGLRRLALQELQPGRQVPQQIRHLHRRAHGRADLRDHRLCPAIDRHAGRGQITLTPRREHEPRDAGDRRQRLAAEPHAHERPQIIDDPQLARGVAAERRDGVGGAHPDAVVAHPHQGPAAGLGLDRDRACPRIERVVDQLLHDGGRPLDHLTGGDLVDHVRRQHEDGGRGIHGSAVTRRCGARAASRIR